jgi:hypothetical protein
MAYSFAPVKCEQFNPELVLNADKRVKFFEEGDHYWCTDENFLKLIWIIQIN